MSKALNIRNTIKVRDYVKGDKNFILATYLQHNWYSKENSTTLKKDTWMKLQHDRIERVLDTGKVKVACHVEDISVICGYAFEDGEKPFCYIKHHYRDDPKKNLVLELREKLLETLTGEKK